MAYLNTMKAIEKGAALVHEHRRYDIDVGSLNYIMGISDKGDYINSMYSGVINGFNIGFIQGFKAANAAMRKDGNI